MSSSAPAGLPCHRVSGGNIRLLARFSGDKGGRRPWRLSSSAGVKNAARWRGHGIPHASELSSLLLKWDPRRSQSTAAPGVTGSPLASPTGLTWRGHPEFTFSETPALPKETESMQLKLLGGHKGRVISPSLSLSLFTLLFVNETIDLGRL